VRVVAVVAALVALAGGLAVGAAGRQAASPLQHRLDKLVAEGVPGAILLVRDGSRTTRLTAGTARLSTREPMRPDDRFRVGSITKSFVSAIVLELVGEGKVSLSDSVERWLPRLVPGGDGITIRNLLNHTSGLYNYTDDPKVVSAFLSRQFERKWTPHELVALAVSHPPLFAPGAQWSYSNTNFILLGLIVEAATGHPLEQELRDRIFTPLGLDATSFPSTPRLPAPYAHGYVYFPSSTKPLDVSRFDPSWAYAAGAIVSTVDDLADFYRALLRGDLVTPHLVWRMESVVSTGYGNGYGLGLGSTHLRCSIVWGHDGDVPGYLTFALSSGNGRRQVVLSLNTDSVSQEVADTVNQLVTAAYCG
jgi:D-alanyl-D-alanine carboxypeptidase